MFERVQVTTIERRMQEPDPLMQVVAGPRQTGKSTMIGQALRKITMPSRFVSADDVLAPSVEWLRTEWQQARNLQERTDGPCVLALDEVQKVSGWPNVVKGLWDADRREGRDLRVILSGSSSLLLRHGLEDTLMGRFELIRSPHWSLLECREAFGYDLQDFLYYGGFPGAARFRGDDRRWQAYLRDAVIEPTISKDVLEGEDVRKPALMRALFDLGARYSAQELSYSKMVGQLQDAGNTTTVAHYLTLLDKAGVLKAVPKYHPKALERKRSTPRLAVYDTALMTAALGVPKDALFADTGLLGHVVESAVGAHLLALAEEHAFEVAWWRDGSAEVDFIVSGLSVLYAIEVKSGRTKSLTGMAEFLKHYPNAIRMIVGGDGADAVPLEEFLACDLLV